jgi:hypothetical protein
MAAAVSAVVAVAIPRGAWVDDIHVVEQADMSRSIKVQLDGHRVVLHAPEGYSIGGWGQSSDPSVEVTMVGEGPPVHVVIRPGRVTDEQQRLGAVAEEIVDGATMTVFSRLSDDVVQRMFDELEIS